MIKRLFLTAAILCSLASSGLAQNAGGGGVGVKPKASPARATTAQANVPATTPVQQQDSTAPLGPPATSTGTRARRTAVQTRAQAAEAAATKALRAAFDTLIDGIRKADAEAVMSIYWNSPQLILFNNNGTVTKSWTQVRSNRETLLRCGTEAGRARREVRVLGPGGRRLVLWSSRRPRRLKPARHGRLTLVFQKVARSGSRPRAHLARPPDPSRLMPSEAQRRSG